MKPKLSIIITHHKTPRLLFTCLDSIKDKLKNINYEIFVADSEAGEGTAFLVHYHYPRAKHLAFRKNVGYAKLVNEGLKEAEGECILILNADTVIQDEKSIREMMEYFNENKKAGIIGPRLVNIDGSTQKSYFKEYTLGTVLARRTLWKKTPWGKHALEKFEFRETKKDYPFEVDWIMGSALMTKKRYVSRVGLIDERYFMYFDDVDWCRQFREKGYRVFYLPQTTIQHLHLKASDSKKGILDILTNRLTRIHIASYLKYLWKWRFKEVKK